MRNYFVNHDVSKVRRVKLVKKCPQVLSQVYFVDKYFSDSMSMFSVVCFFKAQILMKK